MKKILFLILVLIPMTPINTLAITYPNMHYQSAVVYDVTDKKVLYEINSNEINSIASLTKVMTIITAIEKNKEENRVITYTKNMKDNVAWYASVAGFKVGERLTFDDLLYAAMLPSGADATVALAITTSGSIEAFVEEMNNMAKKLGMNNTNFINVHGLDEENHYSTAKDIQILLEYALKNEKFKTIYTTKEYTLSTGKKVNSTVQKQSNKHNLDISKILGSKTGFTENAGLCISVLMNHRGHEIIFVTLGAPTNNNIPYNISDSLNLISFIETNYNVQTLIKKGTIVKKVPIKNSKQEIYPIISSQDINYFLENDYEKEKVKIEYIGKEELSYKDKINDKIGTINYYYNNEKVNEEDIYLSTEIQPDIFKIISSNKLLPIILTTVISILFAITIFKKSHYLKRKITRR